MRKSTPPAVDEHGDETHPCFGVAVVTRATGSGGHSLFQSDLDHQHTIRLSINKATRKRDLNRDWVHVGQEIVSVEMSLTQWGALVSSIGIGSGVPVTIRSVDGDRMVDAVIREPRIQANLDEVRDATGKLLRNAKQTLDALSEAIESKAGVRAVREALRLHANSLAHAENNSAFVVQSLNNAAEQVTSAARADIEAQILNAAIQTGLTPAIALPALEMRPLNNALEAIEGPVVHDDPEQT